MANTLPVTDWAKGAPLYEVNLRQYGSDNNFEAFEKHLPRLADMGIKILWFMPVTPVSAKGRQGSLGSYYACSSYTQTNPEYGTTQEFAHLVKAAQALGMKVIIDWVANHTGQDHNWTKDHPEWYLKNASGHFYDKHGWEDVYDLDYSQPEMRIEMIRSMKFWISACGVNGFRCDMAHLVPLDFWIEARKACDKMKPLFWLAESEDSRYHEVFDASYAWEWMHLTTAQSGTHSSVQPIKALTEHYMTLPEGVGKLFFTTNHDENSWNGTEYEKYGVFARAWATVAALLPGHPLVYSGQEIPNKKRIAFFDRDPIPFTGQYHLHEFYKELFQLRNEIYRSGFLRLDWVGHDFENEVMAFLLKSKQHEVLVVARLAGNKPLRWRPNHLANTHYTNVGTGIKEAADTLSIELLPGDVALYKSNIY